VSQLDAFLRWCHPDLLVERLRHASACWHVLQALAIDPERCRAPEAGSLSLMECSGVQLGLSSAVLASRAEPAGRAPSFPLQPKQASLWVLALLQQLDREPCDPLDAHHWLFWVVPSHQLHPDRRSMALNPLIRAHGEGLTRDHLQDAVSSVLRSSASRQGVPPLQ
jgi:hypothetical protein